MSPNKINNLWKGNNCRLSTSAELFGVEVDERYKQ